MWRRLRWLALGGLLASCGADPEPGQRPGDDPRYGQLEQAATVCAGGATVEGIDVSKWQATVDWAQVAGAGKVFAIARISYGINTIDSYFNQNWAGMKANGLIRGGYQFFLPDQDATAQANIVVNAVGRLGEGDLPVTCDVEDPNPTISASAYAAALRTWSSVVEAGTGKKPIIYTGRYYWDPYVAADFSDHALWHAQYTSASCPNISDYWSDWKIWQYTSSGSCAGVSGNVDLDKFNGSLEDLEAFAGIVSNHVPTGYLDSAGCDGIGGWAHDPDAPDQPIAVHVYLDGAAGAAGASGFPLTADGYRSDLCSAIGSCNHGYSMAIPPAFRDGQAHEVHAYGIDSAGGANAELTGSPKSFTCSAPELPVASAAGVRRHVPNPAVLTAWGWTSLDVLPVSDALLDGYPDGADVPDAPSLVQVTGAPEVYLVDGTIRRHVPSSEAMAAWGFSTGSIAAITSDQLASYVPGPALFASPTLARGSGDPVYLVDAAPPLWGVPVSGALPASLEAGQTASVTFELTNRGSTTWKPGEVVLSPVGPRDHDSLLCDAATWTSCRRAATVAAETAQGANGTFTVTLRAPETPGTVTECFNLVYLDAFWFSDPGELGPADTALCGSVAIVARGDGGSAVTPGRDGGAGNGGAALPVVEAGCGCGSGAGITAWLWAWPLLALRRRGAQMR